MSLLRSLWLNWWRISVFQIYYTTHSIIASTNEYDDWWSVCIQSRTKDYGGRERNQQQREVFRAHESNTRAARSALLACLEAGLQAPASTPKSTPGPGRNGPKYSPQRRPGLSKGPSKQSKEGTEVTAEKRPTAAIGAPKQDGEETRNMLLTDDNAPPTTKEPGDWDYMYCTIQLNTLS